MLEDRNEFFDECFSFLVDAFACLSHHLFKYGYDVYAGLFFCFQNGVALLQRFVVS